MREFRIIFAVNDKAGNARLDMCESVGARLAGTYGGFTQLIGTGGYLMWDNSGFVCESVYIFDCATDDDAASVRNFAFQVAADIRFNMNQESVYFRNIDGEVELLGL